MSKQLFDLYKSLSFEKDNSKWLQKRKELLSSIKFNHDGNFIIYNELENSGSFIHRGKAYYV